MRKLRARLYPGDCRPVMARMAARGFLVDSVVTDPPYHLNFMGKAWDSGNVAFQVETWAAVFAVMKPGAYLLAFGGSRSSHRMVCAIEDAGFEIRDTVMWLYGQGFPKSLDVGKAIDNHLGAERQVTGSKRGKGGQNLNQLSRTGGRDADDAAGCGAYGQGARQVDIDIPVTAPGSPEAAQWQGWGTALKPAHEPIVLARKPLIGTVAANVLAHGTGAMNIDACRIPAVGRPLVIANHCPGFADVGVSGGSKSAGTTDAGRWPANAIHDGSDEVEVAFAAFGERKTGKPTVGAQPTTGNVYGRYGERSTAGGGDTGSASRFFYCAKASTKDRGDSKHATIKPQALMRYLCRLVTPPGGTILDPFCGSGSTLQAARAEGFHSIGIEKDPVSQADTRRRLVA